MKNRKQLLGVLLTLVLFTHCKNGAKETSPAQNEQQQVLFQTAQEASPEAFLPIDLEVILDNTRLRDVAGLKGKEVAKLKKGEKVTFLGGISDFTDKIKLRGIQFDDPWLKVKTTSGKEGWIYGAAIKFKTSDAGQDLKNQLITKRLDKFFGKNLVAEIETYQQNYKQTKTDKEFVQLYRNGKKLSDSLNTKFNEFFEFDNSDTEAPDLFWIDDPIPAMTLGLVAEGTMYQIFTNIKDLSQKANETKGKLDDEFLDILSFMYDDEVEYYFPSWFVQTWDYGGYSLLGQGKHKEMLKRLEQLSKKTTLFNPEINNLKADVISDITERNEYGEKVETILKEVDAIINSGYKILTSNDLIVLKNRRPMFQNPEKHKIELYLKNGE